MLNLHRHCQLDLVLDIVRGEICRVSCCSRFQMMCHHNEHPQSRRRKSLLNIHHTTHRTLRLLTRSILMRSQECHQQALRFHHNALLD